jgi:carotenoid cleavage dioxygenase
VRTEIDFGRGRMPGEPVFVPAANGKNEDDGYLMTFVHDASTDTSEFVIMDASTMSDEPVATVHLPRVPHGFHGSWVPANIAD